MSQSKLHNNIFEAIFLGDIHNMPTRSKFYCLRQGTSKRGEGPKHRIFDHFGWSKYQKNHFRKFPFLSCRGLKTA